MQPYRSPAPRKNPVVTFGDAELARVRGIACLLLIAAGAVLGFALSARYAILSLVGIFAIVRWAKWGALELSRENERLSVRTRSLWPFRRLHVPLGDLAAVALVPVPGSSRAGLEPDYELCLVLRDQRTVPLMRAFTRDELERDRAAIDAFFREHNLFGGKGAPGP